MAWLGLRFLGLTSVFWAFLVFSGLVLTCLCLSQLVRACEILTGPVSFCLFLYLSGLDHACWGLTGLVMAFIILHGFSSLVRAYQGLSGLVWACVGLSGLV